MYAQTYNIDIIFRTTRQYAYMHKKYKQQCMQVLSCMYTYYILFMYKCTVCMNAWMYYVCTYEIMYIVSGVDVCPSVDEQSHHLRVTLMSSYDQGGDPFLFQTHR